MARLSHSGDPAPAGCRTSRDPARRTRLAVWGEGIIPRACHSAAFLLRGSLALLLLFVCGLWALAGLAHLLHRWDRRGQRDFLTAYLGTLAAADVWRATMSALAATSASVLVHLPLGEVALTPRLFSPVILLCILMLYAAEGTAKAAALIAYLLAAGLTWGVILPFLAGLGVLVLKRLPIPGELVGPLTAGGVARLVELLALMVGVYAVLVSYQFLANRAVPRWVSGCLALLAGGTVQALLYGLGVFSRAGAWPGKFLGEVGGSLISMAVIIPAAVVSLTWLERQRRSGEVAVPVRPALSVLKDTLELRRSLEESRETVGRLSETLATLNSARHVIVQAAEPSRLMQDICQLLVGARHYRFAWIGLKREGDRVVFPAAQAGAGPGYLDAVRVTWDDSPTGHGPMGAAIRENRPSVVSDTRTDPRFGLWRSEAVPRGYLSIVGLPMRTAGEVVGGLAVYADRTSAFGQDDIELLQGVADDLAHGLERVRAEQQNARRLRQLDILRAMTEDMISLRDPPRLQERMLERAVELLEGSSAGLYLCDSDRRQLRGSASFRLPIELRGVELDYGDGAAGRAAETKQGVIVPDYRIWPERSGVFAPDVPFQAVLAAPMIWQGEVIGVIDVLRDEQMMPFTSDDLDLLQLFANQAAPVLENASLFARADAERQRLGLLVDIGRDLASSEDPDALLQQAVRMTTQQLGGRSGSGFVFDPRNGSLTLTAACRADGLPVESLAPYLGLRPGQGLEGWVAEHRQACRVDDVRSDPRWVQIPGVDEAGGAAISAPLLVEDRLLGVMTILGNVVFTQDHLDLLEAITRQVALALSNAGRFKELERQFLEQVAVQQVAQVIGRRLEMQPLLEEVCRQVAGVLRYPNVEIMLVEGEELVMRAAQGSEQAVGMHVPLSQGIVGRVARTDQTALVPDTQLDPDYVMAIPTTRSEIVVPLRKGHVVIGVLNVESPIPRGLTEDDARLLSLLGDQVSVAIENAALYDRLRRHSTDLEQTVAERTARLAEALEQAKEADRLKTQFVADVSHELRTPLTNIRLYLELIGQASRERFEEYLKTLNRETERLVDLIEDLLAISRLDAGTHPPQPVSLDLNELARGLVADRKRLFDERKIEVVFQPDEHLPRVVADERMLTQVLANLMTNAMNYTLPGGRVSISTDLTPQDGVEWVTLQVADTGLGIPASEVGQVFERFFRGAASRQMGTPGTGLGLSICKEILDRHKGRISVQSRSGEGSTFTIWLPKP
jgi:signal transduction histidine kinase